jgi:small acid-soluble spore protein H (minor)
MDVKRAQQIAKSGEMVHVTHHGTQVYILDVDTNKETAKVYALHTPSQEYETPLTTLEE